MMTNGLKTDVQLRAATAADQEAIIKIIHDAEINPIGLKWDHFLLAVDNGQIVGTGQIKRHGDSSLELASIAVIPSWQGQGIGSLVINNLIAQHMQHSVAPLYLMCRSALEGYYNRFGFQRISRDATPPYFRRITVIGAIVMGARRFLRPDDFDSLLVMRHDVHCRKSG